MIDIERHATYTIKIDRLTRNALLEALQDWTADKEPVVTKLLDEPSYDPTAPGLPDSWQRMRRLTDALRDVDQYNTIKTG